MARYLVVGEKVAPSGKVVGGNGDWYDAETPEAAEAAFRVDFPDNEHVTWRVTVTVDD